jgi:peptidoglycan/xylan/chitin deacetylase (PgdA/CDA1 family)/glycosyltransferase involved in cell wall biosynthesis/SAM-dependent methyltransferase
MTPGSIAAVITCHDLGRTLVAALESVERQTRPAAEIVVVDDDSSDIYTRQLLAQLVREGTRVVHAGGCGASAARNLGARLTTAEYLVCLDADDTLERGYFEAAAAHLDSDADLYFVSCAMRAFEGASYVWSPSAPTFVDAISTGGVPHASTMLRRRLWKEVGGFDESLRSFELLDFWASAIERGFRGVILDEPLLNYRVRTGSRYRQSIQPETYLARLRHFYAKHGAAIERHGLELIEGKEAFLVSQREYLETLESRKRSLTEELARLRQDISETVGALESLGSSRVAWGDLQRVRPLSRQWGRDRGTSIDRHYIERFLHQHRADIQGRVLEVHDSIYTERFGGNAVMTRDVIDIDPGNHLASLVADLRHADAIPEATYDCIILTQTLQLIDDIPAVLAECARILRPGGVLLATVPSVIRVDDEAGPDRDYWRLTEASARKLFAGVFLLDAFEVTAYGNVMACSAFLYGLSAEEMTPADLDHVDPTFPVVITIRAVKPDVVNRNAGSASRRIEVRSDQAARDSRAVILVYHRVADLQPDSHRLCTPPDAFREHMAYIRRECLPISMDELVRRAAEGNIPERSVAVTLDDGYLDAITTASPILSDFGVPATFFVNTDRLDEPHERWWDIVERVFLCETTPPRLVLKVNGRDMTLRTATLSERAEALKRLNETAWPLDTCARTKLVRDILSWSSTNGFPRDTHRVLTGDEIRALASRPGHSVGAHTVHHLALTTKPLETKRKEIVENKAALEQLLGKPLHLFSYPYGDFDADVLAIVREAGFRAAVTVQAGLVSAGTNRLLFPRYEVTPADHGCFPRRLRVLLEGLD